MGAIHSIKIQTGPTEKSGPPQKVDQFFRLDRTDPLSFGSNGSRLSRPMSLNPLFYLNYLFLFPAIYIYTFDFI